MYENPRIISTPISNNRLNYDERTNKTIVVPSLIEGFLADVEVGERVAIECEVDGKIMAGKWLKNFIFLKNARVPTWIMDNHNHAFAFWHEALSKWYIHAGSLLVHIDQHTDLATPNLEKREEIKDEKDGLWNNNPPFWTLHFELWTLEEIEDYTNTVLTIADFIVPALANWLISEALMVTGENMHTTQSFVWEKNKEKRIKNKDGSLIKKSSSLSPLTFDLFPPRSIVVDIDLDYFAQGFDEEICMETVKYWIERADIITVATSPLFIDQSEALRVLKNLQKALETL